MDYKRSMKSGSQNPYFDEATKEELRAIEGDEKEIKERFYADLEFGTSRFKRYHRGRYKPYERLYCA